LTERVLSGLAKEPTPKVIPDSRIIEPEAIVVRPNVDFITNFSHMDLYSPAMKIEE